MHHRRSLVITAAIATLSTLASRSDADTYQVLNSFDPLSAKTVVNVQAHPVLLDGSLYFTGIQGGPNGDGSIGRYDIASNTISPVYGFTDFGAGGYCGVTLGPDGYLYGVESSAPKVYRIAPDGSDFQILHTFSGIGIGFDGPVTLSGNTLYLASSGTPAIYSMNLDGSNFQTLHTSSIENPPANFAGLTVSGSTVYGVTANNIFRMNTDGSNFTEFLPTNTLLPFSNFETTPILSGNVLYGMAAGGGANAGGVLYSVNTDGADLTDLHDFEHLAEPADSLYLLGNTLYGMTQKGGANADGYIFSINTDGANFQIIHTFTGGTTDGANPRGSFAYDPATDTLFGTTLNQGANDFGILFSITIPEPASLSLLTLAAPLLLRRRK